MVIRPVAEAFNGFKSQGPNHVVQSLPAVTLTLYAVQPVKGLKPSSLQRSLPTP